MVRRLDSDSDAFYEVCNKRNNIESIFSSMKRIISHILRSKKFDMQRKELALFVLRYDLNLLIT